MPIISRCVATVHFTSLVSRSVCNRSSVAVQEEEALKAKFRPLEELKKDLAEMDMRVETDVDIMRRLITKFNSSNATVEERVKALLDLEYLVHQVNFSRWISTKRMDVP